MRIALILGLALTGLHMLALLRTATTATRSTKSTRSTRSSSTIKAEAPMKPSSALATSPSTLPTCVRRMAAAFRGQAARYGLRSQEAASYSHVQSLNAFRDLGFEVHAFLATTTDSSSTLRVLKSIYQPLEIGIVDVAKCRGKPSYCYQVAAMKKAIDLILATSINYSHVLLCRLDLRLKMDLPSTPGLVQANFTACPMPMQTKHTYFGAFKGGRVQGTTYQLLPKYVSDFLLLAPAHILHCVQNWWTKDPRRYRTANWIRACDPYAGAAEGVLIPGFFDEGVKGHSNPLYDIPGRQLPGKCGRAEEFRWLASLNTSCCTRRGDQNFCRDGCDQLCSKCARKCNPMAPELTCCGKGPSKLLPLGEATLEKEWWLVAPWPA
ncbi:unnamed protein product [Effrenium voratum]|uniref:Uncharacterized protein n=1 Tax=Effrenium voratum TaxID=2562239 RepID=A0AA36MQR8_9DINO|nr:unnamed protein product [Effrenium voratum]CAJ1381990.1 unnamed protein product [Effrenium voratum]CAJ1432942.1 unnamed protein product [Effrenium voratum]